MGELKLESKMNCTKNKKKVAISIHQMKKISKKDYVFLTDCIETFYMKIKRGLINFQTSFYCYLFFFCNNSIIFKIASLSSCSNS